jgi:hypothetical protein
MSHTTILIILGCLILLAIGGVIAFGIYAILSGRREDKEYSTTALPSIDQLNAAASEADSLDSLSVNDILKNNQASSNQENVSLPLPSLSSTDTDSMPMPMPTPPIDLPDVQPVVSDERSVSTINNENPFSSSPFEA